MEGKSEKLAEALLGAWLKGLTSDAKRHISDHDLSCLESMVVAALDGEMKLEDFVSELEEEDSN